MYCYCSRSDESHSAENLLSHNVEETYESSYVKASVSVILREELNLLLNQTLVWKP